MADQGITALEKHVDSLIVVPNEKLLPVLGKIRHSWLLLEKLIMSYMGR